MFKGDVNELPGRHIIISICNFFSLITSSAGEGSFTGLVTSTATFIGLLLFPTFIALKSGKIKPETLALMWVLFLLLIVLLFSMYAMVMLSQPPNPAEEGRFILLALGLGYISLTVFVSGAMRKSTLSVIIYFLLLLNWPMFVLFLFNYFTRSDDI